MLNFVQRPLIKNTLATGLLVLLASCGGGTSFPPVVTGFKAQTVQYSKTAVIQVGGDDLRSNMTVDTGGACTNPSFASNSSTSLLVVNCTVVKVGEMAFTLKDGSGNVVYQTTVTVPKPQVALTTSAGSFTLELDPATVPTTVDNFLSYVNSGFYVNTLFHRVVPGFVAQGGGFSEGMVQKTGLSAPIALESNKGLSNLRGTVAMARTGVANSATSQFFINLVDNTSLDYQNPDNRGYAVFGTVVQGLSVADAMATQPTSTVTVGVNVYENVPLTDVTITSATQIK
jgi:cyclophilin family peptidyl-prolyl cis-trans isomerase